MALSSSPDLGVLGETAVFFAPRAAFEAIDADAIMRRPDEDGVAHSQILLGNRGPDRSQVQVTCGVEMGLRLLCAWIGASADDSKLEEPLLASLQSAAAAARTAYDQARRTREMGCF